MAPTPQNTTNTQTFGEINPLEVSQNPSTFSKAKITGYEKWKRHFVTGGTSDDWHVWAEKEGVDPNSVAGAAHLEPKSSAAFSSFKAETKDDRVFQRVAGFEPLSRVLELAYDQSARGKGQQRHVNGLPFNEQPIMTIGRMSGLGGHVYQIMKKAQEANGMSQRGDADAARRELLGVIVYAAAAYLLVEAR